ncbi:hypothetical protein GCM10010094_93700 [Streptomyces flaveus]|uniref:Uncharacterized protein n=1 Tax=Streptomyces flaveus TaxID=66370 RepID=A0A917RPC4_9ACTN|nr:hypothetical protein GCM10010094_93700 [Streptomyces flaveus]
MSHFRAHTPPPAACPDDGGTVPGLTAVHPEESRHRLPSRARHAGRARAATSRQYHYRNWPDFQVLLQKACEAELDRLLEVAGCTGGTLPPPWPCLSDGRCGPPEIRAT